MDLFEILLWGAGLIVVGFILYKVWPSFKDKADQVGDKIDKATDRDGDGKRFK